MSVVQVAEDDGLVKNVVRKSLAGAAHHIVVLLDGRSPLVRLAIGFVDALRHGRANLVGGVDAWHGERGGLRIDDCIVDLKAAEHDVKSCAISNRELRGSQVKIRQVHEASAEIWL